ncbi:hypothetical protein AwPolaro_04860 [Polaromonas sp.]|nr:hypothetical protein AwPolaro_04860 [Polaromonas sp.]
MTALVNSNSDVTVKTYAKKVRSRLATVSNYIGQGFFSITHNSVALLGLALVFFTITLAAKPDLRDASELKLMTWLQERQLVAGDEDFAEPSAIDRATASNPKELPSQQAAIAYWLSKKYSVAPEPLSVLVAEAFQIGQKVKLDPTLILAVMAIESGFNPFAQSPVGAQGLMQVMTKIHHDKYANFGGKFAAFDPVSNLRVGVKVLKDCISRAGSVEGGLKYYVGAANLPNDGGYARKVMAEHTRLLNVVSGTTPSTSSPAPPRLIPVSLPAQQPAAKKAGTTNKVAMLEQS